MRHDYQSYIYKLAHWDTKWQKITHMNNLFKRYFVLSLFGAVGAVFAEIIIYILTKIILWGVNMIRVIEYAQPINFSAHYFSVLVLGNFAILVLCAGYLIGITLHNFFHRLGHYVHGAQKEIKHNMEASSGSKYKW